MMSVVISAAVLFGAALINILLVPRVLTLTTAVGYASLGRSRQSEEGASQSALAFVAMFMILLGWAYLCFVAADYLAGDKIGNRWVLLVAAAALSGAPYYLFQRRSERLGIATRLEPALQSALEYAGGAQSKVVAVAMISGIWMDWWANLPG